MLQRAFAPACSSLLKPVEELDAPLLNDIGFPSLGRSCSILGARHAARRRRRLLAPAGRRFWSLAALSAASGGRTARLLARWLARGRRPPLLLGRRAGGAGILHRLPTFWQSLRRLLQALCHSLVGSHGSVGQQTEQQG